MDIISLIIGFILGLVVGFLGFYFYIRKKVQESLKNLGNLENLLKEFQKLSK